ncbi:MAG: hypothetical protein AAB913_01290 [Patescibacteria group bacterium]
MSIENNFLRKKIFYLILSLNVLSTSDVFSATHLDQDKSKQKTEQTRDIKSNYEISGDSVLVKSLNKETLQTYVYGISTAEILFGLEPGTLVKKISIINESGKNAGFSERDTSAIDLGKDLFMADNKPQENQIDGLEIGKHETFHLLDRIYHISEDTAWQELFKELSLRPENAPKNENIIWDIQYFELINEKNFDPDKQIFGGHSADNIKEFLASFINSITRENWQEIMNKYKEHGGFDDFIIKYKKTLETFQNILTAKKDISSNAPILEIIKQRINFLKSK